MSAPIESVDCLSDDNAVDIGVGYRTMNLDNGDGGSIMALKEGQQLDFITFRYGYSIDYQYEELGYSMGTVAVEGSNHHPVNFSDSDHSVWFAEALNQQTQMFHNNYLSNTEFNNHTDIDDFVLFSDLAELSTSPVSSLYTPLSDLIDYNELYEVNEIQSNAAYDYTENTSSNTVMDNKHGNDINLESYTTQTPSEPVIGTGGDDNINTSSGGQVILTLAGDDNVDGGSGDDEIIGGAGDDTIYGGTGNDVINGGAGSRFMSLDDLTITESFQGQIIFEGEGAGYRNTLGSYVIDENGNITGVTFHFANASSVGSGGDLIPGVSSSPVSLEAGQQLGFFIVSNGYNINNQYQGMDFSTGTLEFRDDNGNPANINDNSPTLWFVAANGTQTQILHNNYHSSSGANGDYNLNPDGVEHIVGLLTPANGTLRIGFEDLFGGGDHDFDDCVLTLYLGEVNTASAPPPSAPPANFTDNDELHGGDGNDEIHGKSGNDLIYGENHHDTIYSGSGDDIAYGGHGHDYIEGNSGDDQLYGGTGNDNILGGSGNDTIYGGNYHDTLEGNSGNDVMYGQHGNDIMHGGSGNDTMRGGMGQDTISGQSGDDVIYGGSGSDIIDGGDGHDVIEGGSGGDIINGSYGNDVIYGNSGFDIIDGYNGEDTIHGGSGRDTITGGNGDDLIYGNSGRDILSGGNDNDTIYGGSSIDEINGDSGNDNLYGGSGSDVISGGAGNDYISGGSGRDTLNGGSGDDFFETGTSRDTVNGGSGNDTVSYAAATSAVHINLHGKRTAGGDSDILYSIENAIGSDFNDFIKGSSADNILEGGLGNDTLRGLKGNDTLTGGSGSDIFTWKETDLVNFLDVITDFDLINDTLQFDLSNYLTLENLDDWFNIVEQGGNTIIQIDRDGADGVYGFTDYIVLENTINVDVNQLNIDVIS